VKNSKEEHESSEENLNPVYGEKEDKEDYTGKKDGVKNNKEVRIKRVD
jgi:hypothetical protein